MLKLNKQVEYSLICLKHMAQKSPGELTSAREISDINGTPFDATSRSLQKLSQMGVLKSEQGPTGGYQIIKDLSTKNLKDLIEATLGPVGIVKCLQDSACEMAGTCNFVSTAEYLNGRVLEFFESISLSELVDYRKSPISQGHQSKENSHKDIKLSQKAREQEVVNP